MKKIIVVFLSLMVFAVSANAQNAEVSKANKAAEKEAKAKVKQKQTEDIIKALKEAGVSDDVSAKFQVIMQDYSTKSSQIKKNEALSEEEKDKQLKANTEEKNAKLSEIIGTDKYKAFNKIRKAQKEADPETYKTNR